MRTGTTGAGSGEWRAGGAGTARGMDKAALAFWVVTVLAGAFLFGGVSRFGGRSPEEIRHTRIPQPVLVGHGALALIGLGLWIAYMFAGEPALGWIAFVVVLAAASLGTTMLVLTLKRDEVVTMPRGDEEHPRAPGPVGYAEHDLPKPLMVAHGLLAATTILLVLLEMLGV